MFSTLSCPICSGVAAGGTAILLGKVLEKYDALGTRILWAADSFDGLPDPSEVCTAQGPFRCNGCGACPYISERLAFAVTPGSIDENGSSCIQRGAVQARTD